MNILKITFILLCALWSIVVAYTKHHFGWDFLLLIFPLLLLVYSSFEDLKEKQINWMLVVLFIVFSLLYFFKVYGFNLALLGLGAFFCSIIPLFLVVVSRERWMGWGDVLLAFGVGALNGYPNSLVAILVAFWAGALFGIIAIGVNKKAKTLAFGPYLLVGCLVALLFADQVIAKYYNLIGF
ncbi:MAG: prepilin peptidase [bacterium]